MAEFKLNLSAAAKWRSTTVLLLAVILLIALASPFNLHAPAAAQGIPPTATATTTGTSTAIPDPAPPMPTGPSEVGNTQAQSSGLFSEVEGEPPPSTDVETLASRLVDIDFGQLAQVIESPAGPKDPPVGEPATPQTLVLNLFDDVVFTGIVEHIEPTASGHALWGRLDGVELGTMTMVVNGSIVVGTVRTLEAVYSIRTAGDGTYVIRQIDESSLPPLGEPLEDALLPRDDNDQADDLRLDDGSEIDVMVVYTPLAKRRTGGRAAIEALIDLYVAETNQVYANSGVNHRISLVLREEVDYTEDGDSILDLRRLKEDSDGHMDHVHELRDLYAADLVHILVGKSDFAGRAYFNGAFGLTLSWSSGLTFAHEIGHNMGLSHDRYMEGAASFPVRGANFGYVNQRALEQGAPESSRWRTIMAGNRQCGRLGGFHCPRLPYFSNPDKTYNGDPMGVPADNSSTGVDGPADAEGTLNDRRVITANFRRSSTSSTPRMSLSPYWLSEREGVSKVRATLHRPSSADTLITVSASPSGAVALSGNGTLTIPAGQRVSNGDLTITGVDNGEQTGDVTVTVSATAANSSRMGVIEPEPVVFAVADDETTPVVTLSLSPVEILERGEEDDASTFLTFTLNNRSSAETTISISWSPAEAIGSVTHTHVTIPAGKTSNDGKYGLARIYAKDDIEFNERKKIVEVSGKATNSQGITGPKSVTLTIIDDDAPSFADDSISYTFKAGVAASRLLPEAAYGNGMLTHSISPSPTNGVTFSAGPPARIGITETSVGANQTSYTLTATDADGDTDTMAVSITVLEGVCPNSAAVSGYADPRIVQDCEALLAARDALRDDQSLNWSEDLAIDRWQGVSIADNRVTGITLNSLGLMGTIPSELGNLSNLQSLILISNKLTGPIPPELGRLPNLQNLRLSGNELTGMIPVGLGDLYKLRTLDIGHNQLIGEIQVELSNLTELQSLDLGWNELTGGIPVWIGELSSLRSLDLNGNELTGEIPVELSNLTELQSLNLGWNQLKGGIPVWLGSLPRLRSLYLSLNQLTGPIPSGLSGLADLEELGLIGNQLTGQIPPELGELANLQKLRLSSNQLTGPIPAQLGRLTNLQELFLGQNHLTGRIPRELGNLANLTSLYLSGNRLSGCVPAGLRDLTNNDFLQLGLPFCDVLLSGLAIGQGELTPPFDPYRTDYTVLTTAPHVTVTPVTKEGATVQFIDQKQNEIADADVSQDGHQIDLDSGVTTISIVVTSQDGLATHTYTIRVADAPGAPAISSVTTGVGNLTIVWSAPDDTGGLDIESYDIRYIEAAADETVESNWTVVEDVWTATSGGDLQYSITGLTGETPYDIQVRAENAKGTGPWSETVTGTPSVPSVCVTGGAVPDATNTGLISDCEALLVARDNLAGSGATRSLNWASDTPLSQWYGVVLSGTPERVTQLRLHGQNANPERGLSEAKLNGTIPPELGRLSELQVLYLHRNNLTGEVSGALNSLSKLRLLYLYDNGLTGISDELGPGMTELRRLFAQRNAMVGEIPAGLGSMTNLDWLTLYSNQLTGEIPAELGGLTGLKRLYVHENGLTGEIPRELAGVSSLTHLLLHRNALTGKVPSELGGLTNLEWLSLYDNKLDGSIPSALGDLSSLEVLYLHGNDLKGPVPSELGNLTAMTNLWLKDNMLSGEIPRELGDLSSLVRVRISGNDFTGCIPAGLTDDEETGRTSDAESLGLEVCEDS